MDERVFYAKSSNTFEKTHTHTRKDKTSFKVIDGSVKEKSNQKQPLLLKTFLFIISLLRIDIKNPSGINYYLNIQ